MLHEKLMLYFISTLINKDSLLICGRRDPNLILEWFSKHSPVLLMPSFSCDYPKPFDSKIETVWCHFLLLHRTCGRLFRYTYLPCVMKGSVYFILYYLKHTFYWYFRMSVLLLLFVSFSPLCFFKCDTRSIFSLAPVQSYRKDGRTSTVYVTFCR